MHGNSFTKVRVLSNDDVCMRSCIFLDFKIRSSRETQCINVARSRKGTAEVFYQFMRDILIK